MEAIPRDHQIELSGCPRLDKTWDSILRYAKAKGLSTSCSHEQAQRLSPRPQNVRSVPRQRQLPVGFCEHDCQRNDIRPNGWSVLPAESPGKEDNFWRTRSRESRTWSSPACYSWGRPLLPAVARLHAISTCCGSSLAKGQGGGPGATCRFWNSVSGRLAHDCLPCLSRFRRASKTSATALIHCSNWSRIQGL
jgi:hypothetical protein